MSQIAPAASRQQGMLGILALPVASILFTLGFACAVPLAAFGAIAAMSFCRRDALVATFGVWLANQLWGFGVLHYPTDASTFAWGGALGVIALLSCEAAGFAARRFSGVVGASAAFLAAFVAYQGLLVAVDLAIGLPCEAFAPAIVGRIFLINACAFGGLWALKTVLANTVIGRGQLAALAPRHA
jgi:hypothetical protein